MPGNFRFVVEVSTDSGDIKRNEKTSRTLHDFGDVHMAFQVALEQLRTYARFKRCGSVVVSVHAEGESCDHE